MVICRSVAVNRSRARIGKGAGYSDLEVALLIEAGLVTADTVIVAPVHALQAIDEVIPETFHDFRVDLVVTPDEVIHCGAPRRPTGLVWEDLREDQIASIPALSAATRRNASASKEYVGRSRRWSRRPTWSRRRCGRTRLEWLWTPGG
jgi:5-formyltetrahydrofolate cyclo-ligase